jgi:Skp family chaperone for outer membrane proteins
MKITRSNYEEWFLDFLDGNLQPSMMGEFQAFLKENPDLETELEMADSPILEANKEIRLDSKSELKKTIDSQEFDFEEQVVAYHEGDLLLSERIKFEAILSENTDKAETAKQFGKLKLIADKSIVYPAKNQLKKSVVILPLWLKVASVAAILILGYLLFQPKVEIKNVPGQLADNLKNQCHKNVGVPTTNLKVEDINVIKTTPTVQIKKKPVVIPVKKSQNLTKEKPEKKVESVPVLRDAEPEPSPLKSRGISFDIPTDVGLAVITLKDTTKASLDIQLSELLKVQLAAMHKSDDRELFSTEHLGLSGLQLFAKLSGKRLTARKGKDGIVKSISYNSRLLALSIPINR